MRSWPIAYHVTFGTYGTRLHGDDRGTVDRQHNQYGEPIIGEDVTRRHQAAARRKYDAVILTVEQQCAVEQEILSEVCSRGGWVLHVGACGPDHVHVLLSAEAKGQSVRRWLKAWLGEALSSRWPTVPGRPWWAEGGSVKYVWEEPHAERVRAYIERQRASVLHGGSSRRG